MRAGEKLKCPQHQVCPGPCPSFSYMPTRTAYATPPLEDDILGDEEDLEKSNPHHIVLSASQFSSVAT